MISFSMIKRRSQAGLLMSDTAPARGFIPGAVVSGVENPHSFADAADILSDSNVNQPASFTPGLLLLADGTRFSGKLFGAETIAQG